MIAMAKRCIFLGSMLSILGCFVSSSLVGQIPPADPKLQARLLEMGEKDQHYRKRLHELSLVASSSDPSVAQECQQLAEKQSHLDSELVVELESIIAEHGWPTISKVGAKANQFAFLILQHASLEKQKKYFPMLRKAAEQNEARPADVAMLEDRIRMREGKPQRYGTQLHENPQTKKLELFPIEDEANVDDRRKEVGLMPLAEYLKHFQLEYSPKSGRQGP